VSLKVLTKATKITKLFDFAKAAYILKSTGQVEFSKGAIGTQ